VFKGYDSNVEVTYSCFKSRHKRKNYLGLNNIYIYKYKIALENYNNNDQQTRF